MSYKKSFITWIIEHPKLCLLISLVAIAGLSTGMTRLKGAYDVRSWFQKTDLDILKLNRFEKKFGHEDNLIIAIHNPNGVINKKTSLKIQTITERLKTFEQINRVESLTNYPLIQSNGDDIESKSLLEEPIENINFIEKIKQVQNEKDLFGFLLSPNLNTTLIYAYTTSLQTNTSLTLKLTHQAKQLVKEFSKDGDQLYLSGTLPITDAYREASSNDLIYLGPLALLMMFLAFLFIFKSPTLFIYPFSVILLSILGSLGLAGFLGFSFNNMTSALPVVLITIGMSDCVHILNWARYEKAETFLFNSLSFNFTASLLTSVSTSIGFFTLGLSVIPPVSEFGILGGFGSMLAWVLTYLLAPICFRTFEKQLIRIGPSKINIQMADRLHEFILNHNFRILLVSGFLSLVFLCLSCLNTINSDLDDYFTKDFWAYKSVQFIKKEIGGIGGPEIVVYSQHEDGIKDPDFLKKIDEFQTELNKIPSVTRTYSLSNIVKKMNYALNASKEKNNEKYYVIPETQQSVAEYLLLYSFNLPAGQSINHLYTVDHKSMKISLLQNSTSSEEGILLIKDIEALGQKMKISGSLEGTFSLIKRLSRIIVTTMLTSLGFSIFLVTLLLVLFLRGPKIYYFSILPNLVPLTIAGGLLYLSGTPVDMGSMIVFSVCFGIAVDDTIHFFVRYVDYQKQGLSTSNNIQQILQKTGSSLIYTSLILMSGFLTFIFADFLPNKNFGIFAAVVLVFALIADLLMLPSLLLYFDKKK